MTKPKNGATEPGNNEAPSKDEDPKTEAGKAQAANGLSKRSQNGKSRQGKGGGPKTKAGKLAVSRNAVKHGIYSFHSVVIEDIETEEEWDRFRDGIVEYLAPEGLLEENLAESIALTRWRLRRVTHAETAELNRQVQQTEDSLFMKDAYLAKDVSKIPKPDPMRLAANQESRIVPFGPVLDNLMRYESHLHRLFVQTLHQLEALQGRRLGQPSSLHRFDFSSSPAQIGNTSAPKLPEVL